MTPRRLLLLGATGSIGSTTLRVLRAHPDRFTLVGIAARSNASACLDIAREFHCPHIALSDPDAAETIRAGLPEDTRLHSGSEAMRSCVAAADADIVLVAVVGIAALAPTLDAIARGFDVALASKEILVLAGDLVTRSAKAAGVRLLPTDSEHNAIFQCLQGNPSTGVDSIILTASGGPFRNRPADDFARITVAEALNHPNWDMGPKITIDSATMANKGLEVIEAHWLFGLGPDKIEVVVHPQSIIHSMVRFRDGSILAQLSPPSMAFAIQHCLLYPERAPCPDPSIDFAVPFHLDFTPPDIHRFPALGLAFDSLRTGGFAPAVFNAANEIAVDAFVRGSIAFPQIAHVIETALERFGDLPSPDQLDAILGLEQEVRDGISTSLPRQLA